MGQVISISSAPRSSNHTWESEAELRGFRKALKALEALKICNREETITAIKNWAAEDCGYLRPEEAQALMDWHGWGRAP